MVSKLYAILCERWCMTDVVLSQRVFDEMEMRIVGRVYPPGTHLVEDAVAAELGVSRTPVREAFRLLQRAGWIELRPHAGAYVKYPTVQEVREVFELRQCLEQRACELAAERATGMHLETLREVIAEGAQAAGRGDSKAVTDLNARFHSTIAEAAGNELLARTLEDLDKHVRWHFSAVALVRGPDSWREHEEILAALSSGGAERAGRLAMEHSARTQEVFFERLFQGDHRSR